MAQSNGDEELRHSIRLELGSMKVEEYSITPQSETIENIMQLFEAYRKQHELEARIDELEQMPSGAWRMGQSFLFERIAELNAERERLGN